MSPTRLQIKKKTLRKKLTLTMKENLDVETTIRDVNSISGETLHDFDIICPARGCVRIPAPLLRTGLVPFSVWLLHRYASTHSHIWVHRYLKTDGLNKRILTSSGNISVSGKE